MASVKSICRRIIAISRRETGIYSRRPLFLFCLLVAPLLCVVFLVTLMKDGLPTELPAGIVDEDNTHISRIITRTLDAMEETDLKYSYPSFSEARKAMQRGETRENLYGHGATEDQAMGVIQPIVVETHPLNNPELDYSVYLNNILVPGILILLIMLSTSYTIGLEWKQGTQKRLYAMAGQSTSVALIGKLLPQTVIFSLMFVLYDVCFYRIMQFPCNCGIGAMMALGVLTVFASQGFGVFFFGVFSGKMRLAMCLCSLWGILSFSLAGFTYPVLAMSPVLEGASWLFPLRQYYLIYVNQALNGYPISYVWTSVIVLVCFALLPVAILWKYRLVFLKYKYQS